MTRSSVASVQPPTVVGPSVPAGNGKHPVFDELIPVQIGGNEQHFRIHLWHQHPLTGDKEIAHAE